MEPITTPSHLLVKQAIDHVRQATEGPELPLDKMSEYVLFLLSPSLSLKQVSDAAESLLRSADQPSGPPAAQPVFLVDVRAVQENALSLLHRQELEHQDNRHDNQKLIDNATNPYTVLVRDPSATPELQEIGILELLKRYPCRGNDARWSPDDAIAFLETKARWLDAALKTWKVDVKAMADDSDSAKTRPVVLCVPVQPDQALRIELLEEQIRLEE